MVQFCVEAGLVLLLSFGTDVVARRRTYKCPLRGRESSVFVALSELSLVVSLKYFQTVSRSHQVEQFGFRFIL